MTELYSLEDVSHNTGENGTRCWVVIRDIVYDFTDYLDDHPGGGELITEYAGKDGTKGFDDFGHSGDAMQMLKPYKIGELIEEDKRANRKKKAKQSKASAQVKGSTAQVNGSTNQVNGSFTNGVIENGSKANTTYFEEQEVSKKRKGRGFLFCR